MAMNEPQNRYFELLLVAKPDGDPYIGIRAVLKLALRRYGLRCVEARELINPPQPSVPIPPA
jgi:hypothetical protein